ncbi:uncharacterized protein TNIN_445921 [Trichonephila inaurata madagascariensis]|uniref:Uncharacterized protein n=1 Tax=Trichonephila inaurata madagascariensis TaxID=2747483 RepID=A0A8X6XFD6_9ARAC|nr:uncharacterized protein TNIN_445921 [Trichonephila inaurata madagascariensis]
MASGGRTYRERVLRPKIIMMADHTSLSKKEYGVTPPECQNEEYNIRDGIVPAFRGESTSKKHYQPQPFLSKLPSYKPSEEFNYPPILLVPYMLETESMSRASYQPMPMDLARTSKPLWMKKKCPFLKYDTRFDFTSSYQADYCGVKTEPRNICPDSKAGGDCRDTEQKTCLEELKIPDKTGLFSENLHDRLNDYVKPLIFRTTTGSAYQIPSVWGEICCHPAKSLEKHCPAEELTAKTCKVHRNQEFHRN